MLRYRFRLVQFSLLTIGFALSVSLSARAQISVSGVVDKTIYPDQVSFTIDATAGFSYDARLDQLPVPVGTPVFVNRVDYHALSIWRTNTATLATTNVLLQFIVHASERGSTEDGLPPWVPYPPIPSAREEFTGAALQILAPQNFPAGLPIPIVAWVENSAGHAVRVNGTATAAGQNSFQLKRGVGSGFLSASNAAGVLNYAPTVGGLQTNKLITIETGTVWTSVSGTLSGTINWPENSRIAITNHLVVGSGATLTIGAGTIVRVHPGIDITNNAAIVINGTWERPVVFTPVAANQPWGGLTMRTSPGSITGSGVIFTGSGAVPNWFGTSGNPSSHRTEQSLFFCGGNNVVTLTDSAAISLAGQLGHAVGGGSFTFNRFLMQRTTSGGEFTGASFRVADSAFIECPDDSVNFVDGDNDALYLWSGTHGFTNTLFGFTKDDAVDSGGDGSGLLSFQDCWFESAFHEGNSLSGNGKQVNHYHSVFLNCGQALEAGYYGPTGTLFNCLATANLSGARFGDNYNWTYDGFLRATNSLFIYNYRDVWGLNWADWTYRTAQMDVRSNHLTRSDAYWPANEIWNPASDASLLASFITSPAANTVGVGFALRTNRISASALTNEIPIRLSSFTTNVVAVDYTVATSSGILASGTVTFQPGETLKQLQLGLAAPNQDLVVLQLRQPVHAEITGHSHLFVLGTNAAPPSATLIPFGATWRYLANGVDQGSGWIPTAYDDSAWQSGAAKFGFSTANTGFATLLGYGPDSANRYRTYYFRKQFVATPSQLNGLALQVLRDDGVALYLNGQDFYRNNLPSGTLSYATLATNAADNGTVPQTATLALTGLVAGTNVLAAELHQSSATSSDLVFDLELIGNPAAAAVLQQSVVNGELVLRWNDDSFGLESAATLAGPWTTMPGSNPQAVELTEAQRFFRLRK